ncbi:hypothetical protein [Streptomyces sp. NPDC000410]|uniref:hypothetical protein n=1 Tax=Streptomyces sp. NPDC000410 TaxID=3154254 RepID=UPI003318845A
MAKKLISTVVGAALIAAAAVGVAASAEDPGWGLSTARQVAAAADPGWGVQDPGWGVVRAKAADPGWGVAPAEVADPGWGSAEA